MQHDPCASHCCRDTTAGLGNHPGLRGFGLSCWPNHHRIARFPPVGLVPETGRESAGSTLGQCKRTQIIMKSRNLLLAATLIAVPLAASAQPVTGWYTN